MPMNIVLTNSPGKTNILFQPFEFNSHLIESLSFILDLVSLFKHLLKLGFLLYSSRTRKV